MAKFGDSYCWLIADDPSVCPYIGESERHLLSDVRRRNREKCIGCDDLRKDLDELRATEGPVFEAMKIVLDEAVEREHKLIGYARYHQTRDEMRDTLLYLSQSLKLALDPDEVAYKGLVAFTAGSSFGFNRGVMLLMENGRLRGYFALGPKDNEEAVRVWRAISDKGISHLLQFSRQVFEKERAKFRSALDRMDFAISEPPFNEVLEISGVGQVRYGIVSEVTADTPVPPPLRDFYQEKTFWIIPLFSHLRKPLGAVLLDNFLTNRRVSPEEKVVMEIFANEIALALERGLTYGELREKIEMLEEANKSIRDHQQTIIKLKEEAAVGEMVLQLTHAIKNPVVAIGGLARHLKKKLGEEASFGKYANAIAQEASRLEETLRDFVKFVDLRYVAERRPVFINQVIEVLVREKREAMGLSSPIALHLDLKPIPPVVANERQLYNCLENIVNNAIEAMGEGGALFLSSDVEDQFITIIIRDTGPGIPEDTVKNLFKPFFTTKATGSGLGLYTSKQIIESLGGEMTVVCEQGAGCEVVIRLPAREETHHGEDSAG